jgi:hypothetical protein
LRAIATDCILGAFPVAEQSWERRQRAASRAGDKETCEFARRVELGAG